MRLIPHKPIYTQINNAWQGTTSSKTAVEFSAIIYVNGSARPIAVASERASPLPISSSPSIPLPLWPIRNKPIPHRTLSLKTARLEADGSKPAYALRIPPLGFADRLSRTHVIPP